MAPRGTTWPPRALWRDCGALARHTEAGQGATVARRSGEASPCLNETQQGHSETVEARKSLTEASRGTAGPPSAL